LILLDTIFRQEGYGKEIGYAMVYMVLDFTSAQDLSGKLA
jgi:hypothetical protein